MYPRIVGDVFLRSTDKGDYIICNGEYYAVDANIVQLIKACDGMHSVLDITSMFDLNCNAEMVAQGLTNLIDEGIVNLYAEPASVPLMCINSEKYPSSLNVEITYKCNMSCRHCMLDEALRLPEIITDTHIFKLIDSMIDVDIKMLTITGGEPFTVKKELYSLIKECSKKNISMAILTNGSLIGLDEIYFMMDNKVDNIQISLDSPIESDHDAIRRFPGSYKQVLKLVEMLKGRGFNNIALSMTVSKNNFQDFPRFIDLCSIYGVSPRLAAVVPVGRGRSKMNRLTEEQQVELYRYTHVFKGEISASLIPEIKCTIGNSPVVTPTGDIYPCMHMKYPQYKLGNILSEDIKSIWSSSDKLHQLVKYDKNHHKPCCSCWNKYLCHLCIGETFSMTGDIVGNNPYRCKANQKITRLLLEVGDEATKSDAFNFLNL